MSQALSIIVWVKLEGPNRLHIWRTLLPIIRLCTQRERILFICSIPTIYTIIQKYVASEGNVFCL